MSTLTIELRTAGRVRSANPSLTLPYPAALTQTNGATTVRQLLTTLVEAEVNAFQRRQSEQRLLPFMTAAAVAEGAARGKIDPRPETPVVPVDPALAVQNALQAFQDALFYLFVNDEQQQGLDHSITVAPESRVTLLRLVALAGG